jgi:membrane associated rhomboid family serine protease
MTQRSNTAKSRLWPFMLGSSILSNAVFVTFRPHGVCLGLSGVTTSLFAACANASPDDSVRILVAGIVPISLSTKTVFELLAGISLLGSFSTRSTIAHLVHLGGLVFGSLYYRLVILEGKTTAKPTKRNNSAVGTDPKRFLFGLFPREPQYEEVKY